jgi:transposase InsO family protein
VDYYSKFIEVDKLGDMSSATTIDTLKGQISRHGIPEMLRTDNGPQFSSKEFDS